MKTKAILLAVAVLAFFGATHLQAGVGYTPATRIAKDPSIPGKGVYGKCLPFAIALNKKFQAAGIPSAVIAYRYEKTANVLDPSGHAVVAFEDNGRLYVMDNQSWKPQWVNAGSLAEVARQFSGVGFEVTQALLVKNAGDARHLRPAGLR